MIDLLSRDEFAALGIEAMLEIEKIPFRRISNLDETSGAPIIAAASDLTADESDFLLARRSLVLNGGAVFAQRCFDSASPGMHVGSCNIPVTAPVWPARVVARAGDLGINSLRLPKTTICSPSGDIEGEVVLPFLESSGDRRRSGAALVRRGDCVWSLVNLGTAFSALMTDAYLPLREGPPRRRLGPHAAANLLFEAYYRLPQALRSFVQRRTYAKLDRRLKEYGDIASSYPVDGTGWLLVELTKAIIRAISGEDTVGLAKWPAPYDSAAVLTHDIEPTDYAYGEGLSRLLRRISDADTKSTLGLVEAPAVAGLDRSTTAEIKRHGVILHGVTHRGDAVVASPERLAGYLSRARERLELKLGRRIRGFRSPRLDRSADLASALDAAGFAFDSSWPDVDRENAKHFGGGVRVNVPFRRPIVDESGKVRVSRCLELPMTAPDCIQSLFGGGSRDALRSDVERKADFIRSIGGLYVALVHGGVFDDDDAAVRESLLEDVLEIIKKQGVWRASLEEVAAWWTSREAVTLETEHGAVSATNNGNRPVEGLSLIIENASGVETRPLPRLEPGEKASIALTGAAKPAA